MKRTLKFSLIGTALVLLACTNLYAQFPGWFWWPQYNGCASGACYRGCPNGRCGVKKETNKEAKEETSEPVESESDETEIILEERPDLAENYEVSPNDLVIDVTFDPSEKEAVIPVVISGEVTDDDVAPSDTVSETPAETPKDVPDEDDGKIETFPIPPFAVEVLELINWHRAQFGLPPLAVDESLMVGCQNHSRYMASYGFGHAYGIGGMECIAMGVNTPESVVNMWLNSSGHRAIIMSRGKKFGFGSFGTFHTLRVR